MLCQQAGINIKARFVLQYFAHELIEDVPMKENQIVESVKFEKKGFGLVECDLKVPNPLKDMFSELPPIIKKCNYQQN